jgi:hypothetical protein
MINNNYESPAWYCLCLLFGTLANALGHIFFFAIVGYIAYGRATISGSLFLVACAVVPFVLRACSFDVACCPANEGKALSRCFTVIYQLTLCTAAPALIWTNNKGYYKWLSLFDTLYGLCRGVKLNILKDGALSYFVNGKCLQRHSKLPSRPNTLRLQHTRTTFSKCRRSNQIYGS